jgi:hypothetical protein
MESDKIRAAGLRSGKRYMQMAWVARLSMAGSKVLILCAPSRAPGWVAKDVRRARNLLGARGCFTQTEILDESGGCVKATTIKRMVTHG